MLESETSEQTHFRRIETEVGQIARRLFGKQISKSMRGFAGIGRRDRRDGLTRTLRREDTKRTTTIPDNRIFIRRHSSQFRVHLYHVQNRLFSIITCTCNHSWYNSSLLYIRVYIQYSLFVQFPKRIDVHRLDPCSFLYFG